MSNEKSIKKRDPFLVFASPLREGNEPLSEADAFQLKPDEEGMVYLKIVRQNYSTMLPAGSLRDSKTMKNPDYNALEPLLLGHYSGKSRVILGILIDWKYLETKESDPMELSKYPQEIDDFKSADKYLKKNSQTGKPLDPAWKFQLIKKGVNNEGGFGVGIYKLPVDQIKVLGAVVVSDEDSKKRKDILYINEQCEELEIPYINEMYSGMNFRDFPKTTKIVDTKYFSDTMSICYGRINSHLPHLPIRPRNEKAWAQDGLNYFKQYVTSFNKKNLDLELGNEDSPIKHKFTISEAVGKKSLKDKLLSLKEEKKGTDTDFHFK